MLQIKEWCDELGLSVKGVHATMGEKNSDLKDYTSLNDYNRLAGVELVKNRVDLAYILNTDAIVLHLGMPWERIAKEPDCLDTVLRPVYSSFDELEPYCKNRHIKLCLENGGGPVDINCLVYDALHKRYSKEFLGLCFDTGHGNLHCKENCLEYAQRYNERLYLIHIHDNHAEGDKHIIPFEGTFNWEGFAPVLARSPYQFPILIESSCKEEGDDTAWLKKAFEAGTRFAAMVEKYR